MYDPFLAPISEPQECDGEAAKIFGNVTEFKEKIWIVMIDEIERGKLEEIKKAIDTIERFKNVSRSGFPIRLVFILCLDRVTLYKYLHDTKYLDENARLIQDFWDNPKNIDKSLWVPVVHPDKMKGLIISKIKEIRSEFEIKDRTEIEHQGFFSLYDDHITADPRRFFQNPQEVYDLIINTLISESPRVVVLFLTSFVFSSVHLYLRPEKVMREEGLFSPISSFGII